MVYGWTREDFLLQVVSSRNIQALPPNLIREDERGLENSRSILVASEGELDLSDKEFESDDHREVVINYHRGVSDGWQGGDLDTVEEVTEPEDSEDNHGFLECRPRSI